MAFLLAPVIAELLSGLGLLVAEAGAEIGLSEAAASTIAKAGVGAIAGAVAGAAEGEIEELIGKETVANAKKSANDAFDEAVAALTQDESYFINKAHERVKTTINFNKDDPEKFHTATVKPTVTNYNFSEGQQLSGIGTIEKVESSKVGAKDIANFLVAFSSEVASQAISGKIDKVAAAVKVVSDNPDHADTLTLLSPFLKNKVPNTKLYADISAVYNGQGISLANSITMYRDPKSKLLYFVLKDELGALSTLYQTTGIVLPAYPGTVFMGPRSPNNNYPTGLTDLFCAFHDQSYENGPNLEGDYKLISRCAQQYNNMDAFNQKLARICIAYFGTLGSAVSNLLGSAPSDINKNVSNQVINNDIFSQIEPGMAIRPIEQYNKRTEFYDELFTEIDNLSTTSSVIAQSGGVSSSSRIIAEEFGDIIVSIN